MGKASQDYEKIHSEATAKDERILELEG